MTANVVPLHVERVEPVRSGTRVADCAAAARAIGRTRRRLSGDCAVGAIPGFAMAVSRC